MRIQSLTLAFLAALSLTGCMTTGTDASAYNTTTVKKSQYVKKQNSNQQQTKTVGEYAKDIQDGSSAVHSAVGAIQSIQSLLGR